MQCEYFDAGRCRSCELMGVPYAEQLAAKDAATRALLAARPEAEWLEPVPSAEAGFRNKAKMVVGGTVDAPTLGILDPRRRGVDLRDCGVLAPGLRAVLPAIADFVTLARIAPYDVDARRGELKHVLLTESADGELMLRLVLRSTEALGRIRKHLPTLLAALPTLRVVSANLQPEPKAVIEGPEELALVGEELPMRVDELVLHLHPGAFFQTNTAIAAALYRQAAEWAADAGEVWDLFCGVGGFGLALADGRRRVTGGELSVPAIDAARRSAAELGRTADFVVADAAEWALARPNAPELVVVNPPRRGVGPELCDWLERAAPGAVIYSSCNPVSLARDLAALPSYAASSMRVFDMFPQTRHAEVMALLVRRSG